MKLVPRQPLEVPMLTVPEAIAYIYATEKLWLADEIAALRAQDTARATLCKHLAAAMRKLAEDLTEQVIAA